MSYSGKTLLLDPYLGEKGSGPSYAGKEHSPVVPLPIPLEEILDGVEAVVVSHAHSDHFDTTAREILPKDRPLLCQPEDEHTMRDLRFTDVHPVAGMLWLDEISVSRTPGRHGSGAVLKDMGVVSGFFFEAPGEPSVYWTGDTVLTDEIRELLRVRRPDVVLTHSCGAVWGEGTHHSDGRRADCGGMPPCAGKHRRRHPHGSGGPRHGEQDAAPRNGKKKRHSRRAPADPARRREHRNPAPQLIRETHVLS